MAAKKINWNTTSWEARIIQRIAERAWDLRVKGYATMQDLEMDIAATHLNGCRLDLERMLAASDFDLCHDISGIHNCLDRTTGRLIGNYVPRLAERY